MMSFGLASAQVFVDPNVEESARQSVQKLGNEVMANNVNFAIEKIYPRWKSRLAMQMGGEDKLVARMQQVPDELLRAGVSIISFRADRPTQFYEVWPSRIERVIDGRKQEVVVKHHLTMVPTVTRFRIIDQKAGKVHHIDSYGFQVAVSEMGKNEWTFIDGATISEADLRSLFPTIPTVANGLQLPVCKKEEVK
ncbi:hypothetical protein [Persicirhabdus sediminis]|uniref:Uncharacterized protein n=1 Tax=Persicirhabdus sediminis TaxID=454144 RepID=A0A8J7ME62_9BACT|nr:hypothetical protein [Persicirhabdus sediminis]MBK1790174.1 hypothetical protein [Persicirhabdus sediminis]